MNGKLYLLLALTLLSVISLSSQTVVTITDADLVGGQEPSVDELAKDLVSGFTGRYTLNSAALGTAIAFLNSS